MRLGMERHTSGAAAPAESPLVSSPGRPGAEEPGRDSQPLLGRELRPWSPGPSDWFGPTTLGRRTHGLASQRRTPTEQSCSGSAARHRAAVPGAIAVRCPRCQKTVAAALPVGDRQANRGQRELHEKYPELRLLRDAILSALAVRGTTDHKPPTNNHNNDHNHQNHLNPNDHADPHNNDHYYNHHYHHYYHDYLY